MRFALPAIIFVGLVVLFAYNLNRDPTLVPSPLIGKPAPAFDLPTLGGQPAQMSVADLKGRPVLVNFFASWCVSCKIEHPYLLQLAREDRVPIIGIDYKDTDGAARQWLAQHGDPYRRVVLDHVGDMGINWGVYGVPETFVLDAQGVIRYKQVGPMTAEAWRRHVEPLLQAPQSTSVKAPS